jgi:hypothetical protein
MSTSDIIALIGVALTVSSIVYQGGKISEKLDGIFRQMASHEKADEKRFGEIGEHFLRTEKHLENTDKKVQDNESQLQYMSGLVKTKSGAHLERPHHGHLASEG